MWDLRQARPTLSLAAHQHEVLAADWCKYNDCVIATGSVDKSIKVCVLVVLGGGAWAQWVGRRHHPALSQCVAVGDDSALWTTGFPGQPAAYGPSAIRCHQLCFCHCNPSQLPFPAQTSDSAQVWDVRMPGQEVATLLGHSYAVRRVLFSPHVETLVASCRQAAAGVWCGGGRLAAGGCWLLLLLAAAAAVGPSNLSHNTDLSLEHNASYASSIDPAPLLCWLAGWPHIACSYDMTVRLWDYAAPEHALVRVWDHHSEFAVGLDWSSLVEGLLASCGWDEMTYCWHMDGDPRAA